MFVFAHRQSGGNVMWRDRLFIGAIVTTVIAGTSLSIGSGRAEALGIPWEAVVAGAEKIAPVVAKNLRILAEDAASLFESNAKLKPINDEVELASREIGKPLMLYNLKEIYDNYESGCICAGTAELAVFIAKQRYCEGGE
jgi:hypothetical protein